MSLAPVLDAAPRSSTPAAVLTRVAENRAAADAAEVEVLVAATEWADLHPALEERVDQRWEVPQPQPARELTRPQLVALSEFHPDLLDADGNLTLPTTATDGHDPFSDADDAATWAGIPAIAWDAPAEFAVANRMSTTAAKALIRDALILRHRLPATWREVLAGRVVAWRARRIAQQCLAAPVDVVEDIDARLAPVAGTIGPVGLADLLDAAMLRLHAELREYQQLDALDHRTVTLDEATMGHTGLADLSIHSDWADLTDLHTTLTHLAGLLADPTVAARVDPAHAHDITTATLDVRRAIAAGVLADPDLAADLLRLLETSPADTDDTDDTDTDETQSEPRRPVSRRRVELVVHLTDAALYGMDPLVRCERLGPQLATVVAAWASRPDTEIHVRPVIDLNDLPAPAGCYERAYQPGPKLSEIVGLLHPRCVHPYCEQPARACDCDHTVPWPHGPTCVHNLAPLCRHHHRLKTHTRWTYEAIDPLAGVYHWTSPHGLTLVVDHNGTHPLTT